MKKLFGTGKGKGKKTTPVKPTTLGEAKPESRQIESPVEPMALGGAKPKSQQVESLMQPMALGGMKPKSRQVESLLEPMALGGVKPKSRQVKSLMQPKTFRESKNKNRMKAKHLTCDDLEVGKSLDELKQIKLRKINKAFEDFTTKALEFSKEGHKILFRFYEPKGGLASLAEQKHMTKMTEDIALLVKDKHMLENTKSIEVDDGETKTIYYSPLLSTTENI